MTDAGRKAVIKRKFGRYGGTVAGIAAIFLSTMFFIMPDTSSESVKASLLRCADNVIPVIFPFTVASNLFSASGVSDFVNEALSRPFRFLFGMRRGASAVLSGLLFGFPIGALAASKLFSGGKITKAECERLLCFACAASPPYPVLAVGRALFGSALSGFLIWSSQAAVSLSVGILLNLIRPLGDADLPPEREDSDISRVSLPRVLTKAVSDASGVMISVCGAVVFFSLSSDVISAAISGFSDNAYITLAVKSIFEFTSGCASSAALYGAGEISFASAMFFAGLSVGTSGFSVMCQTDSVVGSAGDLNIYPYIASKLASGVLTGVICFAAAEIFPCFSESAPASLIGEAVNYVASQRLFSIIFALLAVFLSFLSLLIKYRPCKKQKKGVK
ncbi:MAG: hypothetical protein LUE25_06625 [Clostridiales bacterium]|nr:hypothetical protein [Clostridiales bacterium]